MAVASSHGSRRFLRDLVRRLAVAAVVLGLFQPRVFVWCRAESGHAALEALDAGCCGAPASEARCSPGSAETSPPGHANREGAESGGCRDLLVEAPAGLPQGERLFAPHVVLEDSPLAADAAPALPSPAAAGRGETARIAARDLALSTVLRI